MKLWQIGVAVVCAVAGIAPSDTPVCAATIDAKWIGGTGSWTDPAGWSFSATPATTSVPNNTGGDFFNVLIDTETSTASSVTLGSVIVSVDSVAIGNNDALTVANGRLDVVNDALRPASGVLDNAGLVTVSSTGGNFSGVSNVGTLTLQGGGTLRLGGDVDTVVFAPDDDPDTMRSLSTLGAGNATIVNRNHTIAGTGIISGGSFTGSFDNLAGGIVDADVAGAALVVSVGNRVNLGTMQASNGGILRLFQGDIDQDTGGPDTGTIRARAGSTVHIENSGVTIGGGTLRTDAGGELLIRQSGVTLDDVAFDNQGVTRIESGGNGNAFVSLADSTLAGGQVIVDATSFLQTTGASSIDASTIQGSLTNLGHLTIGPGGGTVSNAYTQAGGTTLLQGSTLSAATIDIHGGTLAGNGTIIGTTTIAGTASAGMSAGILDFSGDTIFAGAILAELGGTAVDGGVATLGAINLATDPATTQFDQYNVFGTATLMAGLALDLALLPGFAPAIGDFFDIITADTLVVDLATLVISAPGLSGGGYFDYSIVSFGGRDALRVMVASRTVAEPTAPVLLAAGLLILAIVSARRRRHA